MRVSIKEILVIYLLLASQLLLSQPYGDEWIDYSKNYYRITLADDGIYKVTYADLQNAGFPVNTVDPRRIQLFYKGEEQAIIVSGQGDAIFNAQDYIIFYGQRNDGTADTPLYQPAAAQTHTLYSLYSDSSSYFLTYNLTPTNGKRMAGYTENNSGGLPPLSSHVAEELLLNISDYAEGQGYSTNDYTKYSFFDYGEGWTSPAIQEAQNLTYQLNIDNTVPADGNPNIEVLLVGRDNLPHVVDVSIGPDPGSLRSLGTFNFNDYTSQLVSTSILWSDFNASYNITVRISALGQGGGNDLISTSYVKINYPQQIDMAGETQKKFTLAAQGGSKSYLEITSTASASTLYDITDTDNVIQIGVNTILGGVSAIVNGTLSERQLIVSADNFLSPKVKKANFRTINASNHNYIIISHSYLMQPAAGSSNPVKSYANYRASVAGGQFDTLVVDMQLLVDQYNYGIKGPLAIYNFMSFLVNEGAPEYLFIIGKGLEPQFNFYRNPAGVITTVQSGRTYEIRDLVPSAGTPGSDILFTAGLGTTTYEPAVPVGRLPARQPEQVMHYLSKVIEMESTPFNELWRKDILHLSGGITANELVLFRSYIDGFEVIVEKPYLGGDVQTIAKTSGSTVELINIADEINNGVNLVTFYGHSAPNITDIDIGFVSDPVLGYNNAGRYPTFLINGCNAGEFFSTNIVFGEDWVLAQNKGALGFIAHSSFGFSNNLRRYSTGFYQTAFGDSLYLNESIAKVQQKLAADYMAANTISPNNITQVQQMIFLGDPVIKLFDVDYPDYNINNEDLELFSFEDEPITAQSDSFAIAIPIQNFGRTRNDSILVSVTRTFPNNVQLTYDSLYANINYSDTLYFVLFNDQEPAFGSNSFSITIDANFTIPELDESNNTASFEAFFPLYGTNNLFPVNYGIVNQSTVNLIAQSSDVLQGSRSFLFQMDTTETFNSPFLQSTSVTANVLATWQVNLLSLAQNGDSVVYFWRTKFASINPGESDEWVQSSFTFVDQGNEGWMQSRIDQFDDNSLSQISLNNIGDQFEFLRTVRDVSITTFGSAYGATTADLSFRVDGLEYNIDNQKRCRLNTLNLIAFDKFDANPYAALPLPFQDVKTCGRQPQVINNLTYNELEAGANNLISYIDNVAQGDSVVTFSLGNVSPTLWSPSVVAKMGEIGVDPVALNSLQDGEPFIIIGKKGAALGAADIILSPDVPAQAQALSADKTITGITAQATINSVVIGPATEWIALKSLTKLKANDASSIDVIGLDFNRNETILFTNITAFPFDLQSIDVNEYPYLKLRFSLEDQVDLSPPELDYWILEYTQPAEGILVADADNTAQQNVMEGQSFDRNFAFVNISNKTFSDSLVLRQEVLTRLTRDLATTELKIQAPLPGDTTQFQLNITTLGKVGSNDYRLAVNPRLQPEVNYDNNILDLKQNIIVEQDEANPLLDVLFDGRYILNGDIVSPTPLITIRLKDENPYLLVSDTTGMRIFLKQECESCNFKRVAFSSPNVNWQSATANSDFQVDYKPDRLEDGFYTLRIEATDFSGNASGDEPYLITFEVVNASTVTHFYPYPNPFSSSTRFVFTLTGTEIPNELIIQIMTVSGKVVREITQDEIGPIYIGNNLTDYAWDGRDEFGDQLANGVYLYRVFIKSNGKVVERRSTSADKAFKNGFGKIYLLR